jgi:hypothetical protein
MDVHSATAQIAEFALRQKAALFASFREDAEPGALIAFDFNLMRNGVWARAARFIVDAPFAP